MGVELRGGRGNRGRAVAQWGPHRPEDCHTPRPGNWLLRRPKSRTMSECDVVIIGAGAAGLGAARRLATAGAAVRVVEARDRVGGRAWTARSPAGLPIELGCAWLHSADKSELSALALQSGLTIDKTHPPWRTQINDVGFGPAAQAEFRAALARLFAQLDEAGRGEGDEPA